MSVCLPHFNFVIVEIQRKTGAVLYSDRYSDGAFIIAVSVKIPLLKNTLLSLSCVFKHFKFLNCTDSYLMHLINVCSLIYH